MMSQGYSKDSANLRKFNIEKRGAIGILDLPEDRELKEEKILNGCVKTVQNEDNKPEMPAMLLLLVL